MMDRAIPSNHDLAAPVESSEGRAKPPKLLALFSREKFAARKKSQKLKSIIQSVREQRCDVWNSSYNSQSSVHFESQQNVRTMLFIPREISERALLHNTAIVNCLWVKQKVLLAEVFIVYERATTKKLLFNRRNGYPQTYLYYSN